MGFVFSALSGVFAWFRNALPWIGGWLGASVSNWAISLGFGVVVFSGFTVLTNRLIATPVDAFNGLNGIGEMGADIIALMGYMWVDSALNLMISTGVYSSISGTFPFFINFSLLYSTLFFETRFSE